MQLRAECGSAFFADLVAHKEVRETYLNTAAAADLRSRPSEEVSFGGITFRRYRGNAAFGVPPDKAHFYPEGVEGLFEIYYAPADTFETVNTLGLPLYARVDPGPGSRRMGAAGDREQPAADLHPAAGAQERQADLMAAAADQETDAPVPDPPSSSTRLPIRRSSACFSAPMPP